MTTKYNRRTVLKMGSAAALASTMPWALGTKPAYAGPRKGGHLRIGTSGGHTSDSLDPILHSDTFAILLGAGSTYNTLTEVAANGSLEGTLAESWEASADAKTWRFTLRKGVEFHNGKSFTSADVVASINHHRGEDSKSPVKQIVNPIVDVKADGARTVVFTLSGGSADFPYLLNDYHLCMMPADAIGQGIGTGGYILDSFDPGVRSVSRRNPNYFKGDSRAHFDSVEIIHIADVSARTSALISGAVDVINRVDLKTVGILQKNPDVRINEQTGNKHYMFQMITQTDPYTDNNVRLAMKYGINREELLQKILRGHGMLGNDHPIGPANRYWHKDLEQRVYDPDKARFHLKKAGMDKLNVELSVAEAGFPGATDAAVLYQSSAAKSGISIDINRVSNDGYWSSIWRKKPLCASYSSGRATEDWILSSSYERGVPWNATQWDNGRFNNILLQARAELDDDKRRQLYYEMQTLIRDDGGAIVPLFANNVEAYSPKLSHGKVGNTWELDGILLAERWWFA